MALTKSGTNGTGDVVIVHSSDLHVDNEYTARVHNGDGNAGLRAVLRTARALKADVVLLAGDVFEHNRLPLDLLEETARLLAEAGREVVLLPGNHDPAVIAESVFHRSAIPEPDNVHVLGVTHEDAVQFKAFDLEIWGNAHLDYVDMAPLAAPRKRTTRWQIAAAHGHYEPAPDMSARHKPAWLISDEQIAATEADYVALGHWNRPVQVGVNGIEAHYSGAPELAQTVNQVRLTQGGGVVVSREKILWK